MKVQATVEVDVTVDLLAQWFTSLDDDSQARFFCSVAAIADREFTKGLSSVASVNADWQWSAIGNHLRDCSCSTERGREMIQTIYGAMR